MKRPSRLARTPAALPLALALALALPAACDSGVPASSGVEGPLKVAGGQHLPGGLPGSPPVEEAGGAAPGPGVTLIEATSRLIFPGEGGKGFSGRTAPEARSLALGFADLGGGHWVVPVGGPDPAAGGELTWQVSCDFGQGIPPGPHTLRFVALDEQGVAGAARDLAVCVSSGVVGDGSACDPAAEPPAAVLSLEWDRDADLDLEVVTPSGRRLGPKRVATAVPGSAGASSAPPTGVIDRDALRGCVPGGGRRESLVWRADPEPGVYLVYANLFDACGEPALRFRASLSVAEAAPSGARALAPRLERSGVLVAIDANGGAGPGLFVTEFAFQLPKGDSYRARRTPLALRAPRQLLGPLPFARALGRIADRGGRALALLPAPPR